MNLQTEIWKQVTQHINGIAIGNCVYTLERIGLLEQLASQSEPTPVAGLIDQFELVPGYCHLTVKLLAAEGLLLRSGDIASGNTLVSLSDIGREWIRWISVYRHYPRLIKSAMNVFKAFEGQLEIDCCHLELVDTLSPVEKTHDPLLLRIANHIRGPIIAALMTEFNRRQLFQLFAAKSGHFIPLDAILDQQSVIKSAVEIFAEQGWMVLKPGEAALTEAGLVAATTAVQYGYSVCYFPTTHSIPEMMLGGQPFPDHSEQEEEAHVDRALDIQFSGEVFSRQCREPFIRMVREIFDHEDFSKQPAVVLDCGAGDGSVLLELYRAVREETRRGKHLKDYPLQIVAAEYNELARKTCAQRLTQAGIPHLVLFGDIGEPEALMRSLQAEGIDIDNILHVNKSVIHNRNYYSPNDQTPAVSPPHSTAVFIMADGQLIANANLERNLLEFFLRWKPFIQKHGMIAIEAHTVPAEITALHVDHSLVTAMDASHGFSHQYLIEFEHYEKIARQAGLTSRNCVQLGSQMAGAPTLSLNHFHTF